MMNFDKLCKFILTEAVAKDEKFANLIIGNSNPVFTAEDIMRDPTDPGKGTKLYLSSPEEKKKGLPPGDPQSVRRQLRRINWVARKLIKKYTGSEGGISIDKLASQITELLERYQTKVLGWEHPDKANTGYETRVIGNLLLPPTKRTPQGKSVFLVPGMDPNAGPEDAAKKIVPKTPRTPRVKGVKSALPGTPISANDLWQRFEEIIQYSDQYFDTDLTEIIKSYAQSGTNTLKDILRDEKIKNEYDPNAVRQVLKGLINQNIITKNPETDELMLNPEDEHLATKIRSAVKPGDEGVEEGEKPILNPDIDASETEGLDEIPSKLDDGEDEANVDMEAEIPDVEPDWYPKDEADLEPETSEDESEDKEETYVSADEVEDRVKDDEENPDEDNWWKE